MTVLVVGDVNVDVEIVLPSDGAAGSEHDHPEPTLTGGGSAANTAAALGRLGVPTRFVGSVGADAYGIAAVESLRAAGVDTSRIVAVETGMTVMVLVVVPADGQRLIYVWPPRGGAHLDLTADRVVAGLVVAKWMHVSGIALRGEPAAAAILNGMEVARSRGIPVSLDVNLRLENWGWESGFRTTITDAIEQADVVLGGLDDEIYPLVGLTEPADALAELTRSGRLAVGRLGAAGALAHDGDRLYESPGFEVEVVDTVGAGDAFDAAFIAARLDDATVAESLRWANAVAALTVGRPGARATPNRFEVLEFLAG